MSEKSLIDLMFLQKHVVFVLWQGRPLNTDITLYFFKRQVKPYENIDVTHFGQVHILL